MTFTTPPTLSSLTASVEGSATALELQIEAGLVELGAVELSLPTGWQDRVHSFWDVDVDQKVA
jgi:hypothetical protein